MQLTSSIARQIVERSMKIIKHSINVMDEHGRIIGSSDPKRLHQKHEGAILALNDHRIVEIDHLMAEKLRGVKTGINLPIMYQQQAIGVVGISGDPELVRNYGEFVKMAAELIVEQAALIDQIQLNKRHKEELILQLIQGDKLSEEQRLSIAERLELDISQPRIAAIIKVQLENGENVLLEHLQRLVHLLEYPERDNLVSILSVSKCEVVILKPITLKNGQWIRSLEQKRTHQLIKRIAREEKFKVRIALGDYFPSLQGICSSYRSAKATLDIADNSEILHYHDHIIPVLLNGLQSDPWRYQQLIQPLQDLMLHDSKGYLVKTLRTFFIQNCDLAQTCQVLHIHRNTLRYRLEKIQQITSLNFNKISDKTRLYLAVNSLL